MSLTREERKLLHQKSKQPTFGTGAPDSSEGNEGEVAYRQVAGSGLVQYVKNNDEWTAVASSGEMPPVRLVGGVSSSSSTSSGVTAHRDLTGLRSPYDDHTQYLLIDGSRAMTGDLSLGGGDGALTFTVAGENSIKIPDNQASALIIEEANAAYLTFVTTNSGEKITLGKKLEAGSVEIEGTAFDINGGNIDATVIGAATQAAGDFTAIGAVSAGTIVGTTIDATTDFTIDGLVITADTITNDAALTVDVATDIELNADGGQVSIKDDTANHFLFDCDNTQFKIYDDTNVNDFFTITIAAEGVTTLATTDADTVVGHLILDADGDITLDPAGGDVYIKTASSVDPSIQFNSNSTDYWRIGVDTSDSNKFKIHGTTATALVDNSSFELSSTGIEIKGGNFTFNTNEINLDNDVSGRLTIESASRGLHINTPVAFTDGAGMAHSDEQLTYDAFALRWKTPTGVTYNGQHIAGGEADYNNNYAMVGTSFLSTKYADEDTDFALVAP